MTTPPSERALARIDMSDPESCWLWPGAIFTGGYGFVWVNRVEGRNRWRAAHRVIYEALVGPIPEGLTLDHLCRVRHCVNPAHLEPVTIAENIRRGGNSIKTHCPEGHAYSEHGFIVRTSTGVERKCRTCKRTRDLAKYHERMLDPAYRQHQARRRREARAA